MHMRHFQSLAEKGWLAFIYESVTKKHLYTKRQVMKEIRRIRVKVKQKLKR